MLTGDMLMLGHAHALTYGHAHTILHCVKNGSLSDFNILSVNIVAKSKKTVDSMGCFLLFIYCFRWFGIHNLKETVDRQILSLVWRVRKTSTEIKI